MKKKTLLFFVFFLLLYPFFNLKTFAFTDENLNSIAESASYSSFESNVLTKEELSGEKKIGIFEKLFEIAVDGIKRNGPSAAKSFLPLLSALVVSSIFASLNSFGDELETVCSYVSLLAVSAAAYSVIYKLFVFVTAALSTFTATVSGFLPIMASLYVFSGNMSAAAASGSGLSIFLVFVSAVCSKILLPLLRVGFAFALASAFPDAPDLSSFSGTLKTTALTLMGFIFALFGFTLYVQTSVASLSDSYLTKTVRFASGSFVPVIGGVLGDAFKTVAASVGVVKGVFGAAGVVTVLAIVLPPVIYCALTALLFRLCAAFAKALSCNREAKFLDTLRGMISVLTSLSIGSGVVVIIALATFLTVKNS